MSTPTDHLQNEARRLFVQSCAALDADTRDRLRGARTRALQAAPIRRKPHMLLLPASAMAASVLAVAMLWNYQPAPSIAPAPPSSHITKAVPDNADIDLYSDLEFYRWLANQPAVAQTHGN
ncbi:MAG: hypothetical protein L0H70_06805 [Xanthomonadales bacterium]|nr:hypothetical protein [Xanthomonadales bacterium]